MKKLLIISVTLALVTSTFGMSTIIRNWRSIGAGALAIGQLATDIVDRKKDADKVNETLAQRGTKEHPTMSAINPPSSKASNSQDPKKSNNAPSNSESASPVGRKAGPSETEKLQRAELARVREVHSRDVRGSRDPGNRNSGSGRSEREKGSWKR